MFDVLIVYEGCLRHKAGENNTRFFIITLLLAWIWPIWILVGFCWAGDMGKIL